MHVALTPGASVPLRVAFLGWLAPDGTVQNLYVANYEAFPVRATFTRLSDGMTFSQRWNGFSGDAYDARFFPFRTNDIRVDLAREAQ